MLIFADLGHDPKHWPSEAATAADQSDDRGAPAFGGRDSGRPIGGVCMGGRLTAIVDAKSIGYLLTANGQWQTFLFVAHELGLNRNRSRHFKN